MDNSKFFKEFFTCPSCGKALCEKSKLAGFDDNYCVNCGAEITSARNLALEEMLNTTKKELGSTYKNEKPSCESGQIVHKKTIINTKMTCQGTTSVYRNKRNHLQECQNLAVLFHVSLDYAINNYDSLLRLSKSCDWQQNRKEIKKMPEMIQTRKSAVSTIDFEKILMVLQALSQDFIPGSKKRKFMFDYEEEEQAVEFTIFKVEDETKENSQTEKMEMIKFHGWIKSFDDLKGTGLMQTTAFSVSRDTIEKIVKNIPYLAERIQLKNKVRVIADYDPQMKEVVFNHYEIKT